MNKKIYFNDKFLAFVDEEPQNSQNQSIRFMNTFSEKGIKNLMDELVSESGSKASKTQSEFYAHSNTFEQVLDYLKEKLYYIEAAGGFIQRKDKFLFIFRLNRWDLPKGKLEKKESIEQAAIRECEEECAIEELTIKQQLSSTFHLYKYKDSYAIKQTYWFYMTTTFDKELKPQIEENIEKVEWFDVNGIKESVLKSTYFTISDVVNEALGVVKL